LDNLARRFDYIFEKENKYPGAPSVVPFEVINGQKFQIKNQEVIPINAMHGDLQVFGYRIKDFVYLTDVKTMETSEIEKLKNVEVLVINALRFEPHNTHFNIEEALNFINLVRPKKAYLTHISHILGLHEEVQKQLPENVFLAYDNLELEIK
jgi:phosphoribosyl 1,2-cyclic phosphate phosphodiesterase